MKKAMKKTMKKAKARSKNTVNMIDSLHRCIQSDQLKLKAAYEKTLSTIAKSMAKLTKSLDKAKKQAAKKKSEKSMLAAKLVTSLQKEMDTLKTNKSMYENGYKKLIAQQKASTLFEKEWKKNRKNVVKKGKVTRSKIKRVTKEIPVAPEVVQESTMIETTPVEL